MAFAIELSARARANLQRLRKRDQQIIMDTIDAQLTHQPLTPTSRRKKLQENPFAPWELRIGSFRVFYDVIADDEKVVVLAVGHKVHNILWIGDEVLEL